MNAPESQKNDPSKAGQKASKVLTHGKFNRYATYAMHTRFQNVTWITSDAEQKDEHNENLPKIIRQSDSFEDAVRGILCPMDELADQAQSLNMGY